jgi:hypothetical protein
MLPNDAISTVPITAPFLWPDSQRLTFLEDFEAGGVDIQDTSAGLSDYRWRCFVGPTGIHIQRDGLPDQLWITVNGVLEVALAFDQNMRPAVAYRLQDGRVYLRWYDSQIAQYTTTDFGLGKNPRLTLDDKRPSQMANSDVIFAYMRDGAVYYRRQRDRYQVENQIASGLTATTVLRNIGMGTNWRLQFELV